jgi:hypothetical protein
MGRLLYRRLRVVAERARRTAHVIPRYCISHAALTRLRFLASTLTLVVRRQSSTHCGRSRPSTSSTAISAQHIRRTSAERLAVLAQNV